MRLCAAAVRLCAGEAGSLVLAAADLRGAGAAVREASETRCFKAAAGRVGAGDAGRLTAT